MVTEEEIIRRRLLFDGDGTGDDKRITTILKTIVKWSTTEYDEEERNLSFQKILALLSQCEYSMTKHHLSYQMNIKERQNYEVLYQNIQDQIVKAKEEIATCKTELKQARTVRKNKQEYDALAKVIETQPERKQLGREIDNVHSELETLDEAKQKLVQKLEMRQKQFHTLIYSIQLLQMILEDNDETSSSPSTDNEVKILEKVDDPEVMDLTNDG